MNKPTRKPAFVADATQELPAASLVGAFAAAPGPQLSMPKKGASNFPSSIAPVGLDVAGNDDLDDEDPADSFAASPAIARRQRLGRIVMGAVGVCAVILIAAGIARIGHASSEPAALASEPARTEPASTQAQAEATGAQAATATPAPAETPTNGTIRLDRPAVPGHVWLDGKKIAETSMVVSCGTHQIRVGRGRKHSVDVPCGGEVAVTR